MWGYVFCVPKVRVLRGMMARGFIGCGQRSKCKFKHNLTADPVLTSSHYYLIAPHENESEESDESS